VRVLIAKVAAANPSARFRSGKNPIAYWAEHLFLLAMVALLVFVLSLTGFMPLSGHPGRSSSSSSASFRFWLSIRARIGRAASPPTRFRRTCCREYL
jgi:hypothetical protein